MPDCRFGLASDMSATDFVMSPGDVRGPHLNFESVWYCSDLEGTKSGRMGSLFDNSHGTPELLVNPLNTNNMQEILNQIWRKLVTRTRVYKILQFSH